MTPEQLAYLQQLDNELAMQQAQGMNNPQFSPLMGGQNKQNLIEWQLDFKSELLNIRRLLKSDICIIDSDGNETWIANPNREDIILNDKGVNDLLRDVVLLINKNKVLSNYSVEQIRDRVRMIAHEINMKIYNNMENYEINNDYKVNNYPMLVLSLCDPIESAFNRSINGEERKDLNQNKLVTQNEGLAQQGIPQQNFYMAGQKKGKWYNPFTWGK